jgi:hypothetical protein
VAQANKGRRTLGLLRETVFFLRAALVSQELLRV